MAVLIEPLELATLRRGSPIPFRKLEINVIWNAVGSFTLEMPATDRTWALIRLDGSGNLLPIGIVVDWNGITSFSLRAEGWAYKRSLNPETGRITEALILTGSDLLSLLANRIAFPDPTKTWAQQPTTARVYTGAAETVIKQIVAANLVTPGDPARKIPVLDVAPDQQRGQQVSYKVVPIRPAAGPAVGDTPTIGASLMDMVRAVALQSRIGVRLALEGTRLRFDTYLPRDRSQRAVFSAALGNLADADLAVADPTLTNALMQTASPAYFEQAGQGSNDSWTRVEQVIDQTSTDTDAAAAAREALAKGAGTVKLAVRAVDLPRLRFGADVDGVTGYQLGDIVTVDIREDVTYTDLVSRVQLVADATGAAYRETVTPEIGADQTADDNTITAQLAVRLRAVEQRLRATAP
ncbi:Gp37-like protein [Actinomadura rudentiformis]|uniref:Gp28/Gp37-like domain-containing protein n=1 Tax=Actinomadura rudentiformis TaxID=359158 RepID=A0A6H9YFR8_9ACTN|nr:hypothetical protein [Actinomadura rudentiformis]KAB2344890.1 hypothetical protein F8566_30335 [Actinomadura rudentiformis]